MACPITSHCSAPSPFSTKPIPHLPSAPSRVPSHGPPLIPPLVPSHDFSHVPPILHGGKRVTRLSFEKREKERITEREGGKRGRGRPGECVCDLSICRPLDCVKWTEEGPSALVPLPPQAENPLPPVLSFPRARTGEGGGSPAPLCHPIRVPLSPVPNEMKSFPGCSRLFMAECAA